MSRRGGGLELSNPAGFIDDVDEPPKVKKKETDWDEVFAYKTFYMVRIVDMWLGVLYYSIVTLVVCYVVFFALLLNGKHQIERAGVGTVLTRFAGKAFYDGNAYDAWDMRFPEIEPNGCFVATKIVTLPNQKVGKCIDFDQLCPCRDEAECIDGYCEDKAWCPSLGEGSVDEVAKTGKIEIMQGLEDTELQIQAGIAFPGIGNEFFVAGKSTEEATNPVRYIKLKDLFAMGGLEVGDLIEYGAIVSVIFQWRCDVLVPEMCEPVVNVQRIDGADGIYRGFVTKRASRRWEGGEWVRDAVMMYGIRILIDSAGIGREWLFMLFMIQMGSCLALMRTASMIADFVMLNFYPKDRREKYYKCKVKETQDFSDLKDRLNIIQDARAGTKVPDLLRRAPSRTLGLGPGGRGGMASQILKR